MRRNGLIILGIALLACAAVVVVLATGGSSGGKALSPACLPDTIEHTARLQGTGIDVSPAPATGTANPHTQISFLGVPAADIHEVSAVGSHSGAHKGRIEAYSQGDGASFLPAAPFAPGERVTVHAMVGAKGSRTGARRIEFQFRVDTPYPTAHVPEFPNPTPAPSEYQSFATLPGAHPPVLSVIGADRDPAAGDIFTTNGPGPGQYGPLIYTPQGRLVWFQKLAPGKTAEDLSVQEYEGQRDLTWWKGRVLELGFGQGEDIVMNSHYETVARVPGGNGLHADLHEFRIAPGHIAYITAFNPIRCDLAPVKGSREGSITDSAIQEIDMKTGLVRWEWHSLDHVGVQESETPAPNTPRPWDWFHINSIEPEPGGDLLISARNTWAAYQLQGGTGKILWRLGGTKSSFKMGPGTRTVWQHDARILSNGEVTIFDDGSNPPLHHQSRGLRIALDLASHEARLSAAYTHSNPPLLAASQGNMQTLADGNSLIGFGGVPEISEYDSSGRLLFDAHTPFAMIFYRAYRFPWHGRPAAPPATLANLNNTGEQTIVHMSWNGATDIASWRVLAGRRPGSLAPQATILSEGFESSTILPKKYAYAAAQPLDSSGRALGTSRTVRVRSYAASLPGDRSG